MNVVKNILTDLGLFRKCYNLLQEAQRKKAPPPTYPRAALPRRVPVEWNPRPLLDRFVEEADMGKLLKVAAVIGGSVLLVYLISLGLGVGVQEHAGADRDEDEEALIAGRLPAAARRQLLLLTLPLVPRALLVFPPRPLPRWPPRQGQAGTSAVPKVPSTTPHSDIQETEDKAQKRVLKNKTHQATSSVPDVQAMMAQDAKTMFEMESNTRKQNFLQLLKKASEECKGSKDLELNVCKELGGQLESFTDYLASKLEAGEEESIVQSAPERMKEKATLSEPGKTVSNNPGVSLKKTKQSERNQSGATKTN